MAPSADYTWELACNYRLLMSHFPILTLTKWTVPESGWHSSPSTSQSIVSCLETYNRAKRQTDRQTDKNQGNESTWSGILILFAQIQSDTLTSILWQSFIFLSVCVFFISFSSVCIVYYCHMSCVGYLVLWPQDWINYYYCYYYTDAQTDFISCPMLLMHSADNKCNE